MAGTSEFNFYFEIPMHKKLILSSLISLIIPFATAANTPKVAVDIAPVHSLVTQVMEGVGRPELLIQPEASPHNYSLRPSEAEALSEADVVFWVSEELTPWLEKSLENMAASALKVEMLNIEGTTVHAYREGATFEVHDHHHGDEHHSDHHDDDHHEQANTEEHHHGDHDPHAWLDPVNAKIWVEAIAEVLSEQDPDNARTYQSNADAAARKLDDLTTSIQQQADALKETKFIVFHDAYQYFERRFGVLASGAISIGDASDPSPARIKKIQDMVSSLGVTCVFTEPQYNPDLVKTVFEGTSVNTTGVMDPLGADIAVGKNHYDKLLNSMITSLAQCQDNRAM
jgi:zinc transport system substrate-binding protein